MKTSVGSPVVGVANMWKCGRLMLVLTSFAALLGFTRIGSSQSVTSSITNQFDSTNSASGWTYWYDLYQVLYGYNNVILDWDGTKNNGGAAGSGSVLYKSLWPGHASGQWTDGKYYGQNQIWGTFAHTGGNQYDFSQSIDASKYDSISFDVHAEGFGGPCPTNSNGDVCRLTVGLFTGFGSTGGVHGATNIDIPISATNGWFHGVALIDHTVDPAPAPAVGWAFNINCYGGANAILFTNTTATYLWIDNVQVNHSKVVTPPPTMSRVITTPIPGLNLFSTPASSDQYQRTSIKLLSTTGTGWLGQNNVTYSFTITNFPSGATYPGYQAHIFLTTGPGNNSSLDYAETNVIFFDAHQNSNGTAYAAFRYKVNEYQANSNLFGAEYIGPASAGTLAVVGAPTILGTWSITFNQDTNVTVTVPGGGSTNFNMRPDAVTNFVEPINLVFGGQPNGTNNVGQAVILAMASATNAGAGTSIVSDNFMEDSAFDANTWTRLAAAGPTAVQLFPLDPGQKLVRWSLPDAGYGLQTTTNVTAPGSWTILSGNEATGPALNTYSAFGQRVALVPSLNLGPDQNYFRMFTRKFTKLQVLMPGETAAPGTATGKTGTPSPQSVGAQFQIVVNAVDDNWNLAVTADDTVHITSSDTTATLPADTSLTGGTVTLNVTFGTAGTWTVTATDVTNAGRAPNTGTPTTAN